MPGALFDRATINTAPSAYTIFREERISAVTRKGGDLFAHPVLVSITDMVPDGARALSAMQ